MKAGIIGCGRMGAFTSQAVKSYAPQCWFPLSHAESFISHPNIKLTSLCDAEIASLKKASTKYGIDKIYLNYKDLILKERPDFLSIATRTIGRSEIIRFAILNSVKAIHIEKPLCNSVEELEQIMKSTKKRAYKSP